ncbi:hypothetical protein FGRMN_10282 [Fusarium graminum]|nr:hypothetical protein FGRMN_10282 [Fusarium graminum]
MDFSFEGPMCAVGPTPSPGYIMTPSPYYTRTPSPSSRGNIGHQPIPGQAQDPSFFEEAMGGSPIPQEMAFGIMQAPLQYNTALTAYHNHAPSLPLLPSTEAEEKLNQRAKNQRRSQSIMNTAEKASGPASVPISPQPRKRGRKPKGVAKDLRKAHHEIDLGGDDLPRDPRHRRVLERNRLAATKCRLRKRDEASALASQEQAMEDQNRYLSSCFDSLTTEIYHLKTQLLQHTDCNCVLIQKYIANEAKKTVDGLTSCCSTVQPDNDPTSPFRRGSCHSGTSPSESLGLPTPEFEGISPTWSQPLPIGHASSSEVGEGNFDIPLDLKREESILMHNQPLGGMIPFHHSESDSFGGIGLQPRLVDETTWNPPWSF